MKILEFPLARITIWFVIGILSASYFQPDLKFTALLILLLFAKFFIVSRLGKKILFGILLYILSFLIGMSTQIIHVDYLRDSNYTQLLEVKKPHYLKLTIREKLKTNRFSDRYVAIVNIIDGKISSGKILLNVRKDKSSKPLRVGTQIFVKSLIIKHKPPLNPDQFDYGKYLLTKSIPAQLYVDFEQVKVGRDIQKDIWFYSDEFRNKIISNLSKSGFHAEELHVVNALILGQQQDISPDILQDYQFAGAVHILSVSGLHVGFILMFLNFILKPLPNNRLSRILKLIIIVLFLWIFAAIAGFSPSVVRSVTMFSFVACGMYLRRSTNIFHTLLVSALLILLFEPSFLFAVGFQLSYIALFFILWLQPLLAGVWNPKSPVCKYFWEILTVSFAAQIGAFPLSVYYFHQFPGLFFVTNLVIIPLLSLIMAIGVFVMLLASIYYVPTFPAKALEWSIHLMNKIIGWIASFEKFIIQDIPLNFWMLAACYLSIIATIIWFKKPSGSKLIIAFTCVVLLQGSFYISQWRIERESEWIVCHVKKNTIILNRSGKNVKIYSDSDLSNYQNHRMLNSYLIKHFGTLISKNQMKNTFIFKDLKILVVDSNAVVPINCRPDLVLFIKSPKINLDRLLTQFRPKVIIADASNYKTYAKRWEQTCAKQKIPFHYTNEKGFFRLSKKN